MFSTKNVAAQLQICIFGSCDAEDWSNDAENSALITGINCILQKKTVILNCNISQYDLFLYVFLIK